jgi:4a-hydroxytetrahydrobiopterin dehydratase
MLKIRKRCADDDKCGGELLDDHHIEELLGDLPETWHLDGRKHLEREFSFKNFRDGLEFVNKVGELAEGFGHHPDIYLTWGLVRITLWTHVIDGLSKSDFLMAKYIDDL